MNNTIDMKVGIYETTATIIHHRDGSVTIKEPFVRWAQNTGTLAFRKITLTGSAALKAKELFAEPDCDREHIEAVKDFLEANWADIESN